LPKHNNLTLGDKIMAKEQVAKCTEVISYVDKKTGEEREFYKFAFETNPDLEFSVNSSKHFTAKEGQKFVPVVVVYPKAYIDKEGKARSNYGLAVNWELK
jgi:hypothetical protein